MTDVQRWDTAYDRPFADDNGPWVTYADHVEALRQAERRATEATDEAWRNDVIGLRKHAAYEQGQRDAVAHHESIILAAAVQRVEALNIWKYELNGPLEPVGNAVRRAIRGGSDD